MTTVSAHPVAGPRPSGFTLTELMVAVVVLVGVLLAVGKIFTTTARVAAVGEAVGEVLQETAAIERNIRSDIANLSSEGVFAIRCVAVPNNVNRPNAPLLDPSLPDEAFIRADQLLFFASGVESVQTFRVGAGTRQTGQGTISRIYYGHAFQLTEAGGPVPEGQNLLVARDPDVEPDGQRLYPWSTGQIDMVRTQFEFPPGRGDGTEMFSRGVTFGVFLPPLDARRWLFVRQPVALIDDDRQPRATNHKTVYLDNLITARSIFWDDPEIGLSPQIVHGRVDAAATQVDDVRRLVTTNPNRSPRNWRGSRDSQFDLIADQLLHYPRAERYAPGMRRIDQALTNHVLGSSISSVRIDWTYDEGVGEVSDAMGNIRMLGVVIPDPDRHREQPWFGLPDVRLNREDARGIHAYGDSGSDTWWTVAESFSPDNVERIVGSSGRWPDGVEVYEAIFGFNQDNPFASDYTPWPSAIRITLTLHDAGATLEGGREVQFIVHLPQRVRFDAR